MPYPCSLLFPLTEATRKTTAGFLAEQYERWQVLFEAQPVLVQRFFETQARALADALLQPASQTRFRLPDRIIVIAHDSTETPLPPEQREQKVGGFMNHLSRVGIGALLRQRLDELEASPNLPVASSAGLLRFAIATVIVRDTLPSGRSVHYRELRGGEIPTLPVSDNQNPGSAFTAATDAIVEEGSDFQGEDRCELLVPYVSAARRFFLPQWVAFDEQDRLLVRSLAEASAHLSSMQRYLRTLHEAVALAPYMIADENYHQKRYGMLGQLLHQGRALARFETSQMIATLRRRAEANDLNRGLSICLPYFDDQNLEMKTWDFDIIPTGKIMFVPAFVVLAVRKELAKVEQDTRLDRATRNHLLVELLLLEEAFLPASPQ